MTAPEILQRLEGVRLRGAGGWSAHCPSHQDSSPSLSIAESGTRILLHCFSGCDTAQIVAALGLSLRDLFTDAPTPHRHQPTPRPVRTDYAALVFQFELAALDRRLRADNIRKAATNFSVEGLDNMQLDRLMEAVASAYSDRERAEFLETVADDFRLKAFQERISDHAA